MTVALQSKSQHPPRSRDHLERSRLLADVDQGTERPVLLVTAPAGFGKTELLAEWCERTSRDTAWLTLDPLDDDPKRFLEYLLAAIDPSASSPSGIGFEDFVLDPLEAVADIVTRSVADRPLWIVLDGMDEISNPTVREGIRRSVESSPDNIHWIVLSRATVSSFRVARWRTQERVHEIGARDLEFTREESHALLGARHPGLSPQQLDQIHERTEGWPAGLQLASLSLESAPDVTEWLSGAMGTKRFVAQYLVQEVLDRLSVDRRRFLVETSILEVLTAQGCEAVLNESGCQRVLEELEQQSLFVTALDEDRRSFRTHRLFRELLQHELSSVSETRAVELHRRAMNWYEERGLTVEAADAAIESGEWTMVEKLLAPSFARLWRTGEFHVLGKWMDRLPESVVKGSSELSLYAAWVSFSRGEIRNAEEHLSRFDANEESLSPARVVLEAFLAREKSGLAAALELARRARDRASESAVPELTVTADLLGSFLEFESGDVRAARSLVDTVYERARRIQSPYLRLLAKSLRALVLYDEGRLREAASVCRDVADGAFRGGLIDPALARLTHARVLALQDRLEDARVELRLGLDAARASGREVLVAELHAELAWVEERLGDPSAADLEIALANERASRHGAVTRDRCRALEVVIRRHRGESDEVNQWFVDSKSMAGEAPTTSIERQQFLYVRIAIERGMLEEAVHVLAAAAVRAEKSGRKRSAVEIAWLTAIAREAGGKHQQAVEILEPHLALAEREGFRRLFIDDAALGAALFSRLVSTGIARDFIQSIVDELQEIGVPLQLEAAPDLTPREREILELVDAGLSNQEIRKKLHVSEATVKTHLNNLYRKLGAGSRTQALSIARELGLL